MALVPRRHALRTGPFLAAVVAGVAHGGEPPHTATSESSLASCIKIGAHSQITARKDLVVTIRVVGSGFATDREMLPTALWVQPRMPCHLWEMLHYDRSDGIDSRTPVGEFHLGAGTTIDLAWRGGDADGRWLPVGWTMGPMDRTICLRDGDPFPSEVRRTDGSIDDFLARFVNEDGTVLLGARELLYLLEMGPANSNDELPDFRDLAVVVSFRDGESPVADTKSSERGAEDDEHPGPKAMLSGTDPWEEYDTVPPVTLTLTDLAPGSSSYLQVYPDPTHESPREAQVVTDSWVWNGDPTPQDREFTLKKLDRYFVKEGRHTMELVHETTEGRTILCRSSILVSRSGPFRALLYTDE